MMTLTQGIEIAQLAKAKGLATRASNGLIQFVSVSYNAKGKSTVTPMHAEHGDGGWMTYEDAKHLMQS